MVWIKNNKHKTQDILLLLLISVCRVFTLLSKQNLFMKQRVSTVPITEGFVVHHLPHRLTLKWLVSITDDALIFNRTTKSKQRNLGSVKYCSVIIWNQFDS